jgi:RNA polymerase sigma-70 factor (ECF subfamily)
MRISIFLRVEKKTVESRRALGVRRSVTRVAMIAVADCNPCGAEATAPSTNARVRSTVLSDIVGVGKVAGPVPRTAEATAALVRRARGGEREAITVLVRGYMRPAYAAALAILGRAADAEDVAQEALMIAFERLDTCRDPARFASWLLQIVRNRARNQLDWRRVHDVGEGAEVRSPLTVEAPVDQLGLRETLLCALAVLSPVQREVVLLHDLEGWSHAEIASAVDVSEVMSRQHLFQARKIMRERLEGDAATSKRE